jgi:hypothetical protein
MYSIPKIRSISISSDGMYKKFRSKKRSTGKKNVTREPRNSATPARTMSPPR